MDTADDNRSGEKSDKHPCVLKNQTHPGRPIFEGNESESNLVELGLVGAGVVWCGVAMALQSHASSQSTAWRGIVDSCVDLSEWYVAASRFVPRIGGQYERLCNMALRLPVFHRVLNVFLFRFGRIPGRVLGAGIAVNLLAGAGLAAPESLNGYDFDGDGFSDIIRV